jgi:hypothetical protein
VPMDGKTLGENTRVVMRWRIMFNKTTIIRVIMPLKKNKRGKLN